MPYIENYALRLIVLDVACVAAVNLVAFIKARVYELHSPSVYQTH